MIAVGNVEFHNLKLLYLDCQLQWSFIFIIGWVDVIETKHLFVPTNDVFLTKNCSMVQYC